MRISHKRKKEEPQRIYRFNEGITSASVFVLNRDGAPLGTMNTADAIRQAREEEMDLVEINPKADPPIAKIMNFGQFRYQQEKEARIRKAHQHVVETKCVRLSLRIGRNDLDIRKNQTLKFLSEGNKVKVEIVLRGRENQQGKLAFDDLKSFIDEVNAEAQIRYEQNAERQGNRVTAIIAKT
jgi:translation initiation factor IF-3